MTYRSFLELTVNTVPLNPKAVTCIGLGIGCWGARSANNRAKHKTVKYMLLLAQGWDIEVHIYFVQLWIPISLCKTVLGFLYWMVLETYSISWGNDLVFYHADFLIVASFFWCEYWSIHKKTTVFCSPFWFYIFTCIVPLNKIFS